MENLKKRKKENTEKERDKKNHGTKKKAKQIQTNKINRRKHFKQRLNSESFSSKVTPSTCCLPNRNVTNFIWKLHHFLAGSVGMEVNAGFTNHALHILDNVLLMFANLQ
jgi:hypothetical protein